MKRAHMNRVAWLMMAVMFVFGFVPRLEAGFSPSVAATLAKHDRDSDLGKIQTTLETRMIKERLERLGFTKDEIRSRLSNLSDEQIHDLAMHLDSLKVGGDSGVGIVIAVLVIAILVVFLVFLTKHQVVVK